MKSPEHGRGPFQFSEATLTEYPWLRDANLSDEQKMTVSAAVVNNRTVQQAIPKVETGEPNINVDYVSKVAQEALEKVKGFASQVPKLSDLVDNESRLLQENIEAARKAIGDKVRDMNDMGRYK